MCANESAKKHLTYVIGRERERKIENKRGEERKVKECSHYQESSGRFLNSSQFHKKAAVDVGGDDDGGSGGGGDGDS